MMTCIKKNSAGKWVMFYNSPVFSYEYEKQFNQGLGGMVEHQLRLSIYDVASYWYTAWVNGRSPNLSSMDDPLILSNKIKRIISWN